MKTIRRTRITVRKREVTMMNNGDASSHFNENETEICPLCHSEIHSNPQIPTAYETKLLNGTKNLLIEKK